MKMRRRLRRKTRYSMRYLLFRLEYMIHSLWIGGGGWGYLRLLVFLSGSLLFAYLSWWAQTTLQGVSQPFFRLGTLRYLLPPFFAFSAAILLGANYVKDVYDLPFRAALRYLLAALFTFGQPRLTIADGKAQIPEGGMNMLDRIGGPGLLIIKPGNAVMLERLREPSRIVGAGAHAMTRFERIREVISLEDQHGEIDSKIVPTKDGIEVRVRNVQYRYRVRPGRLPGDYTHRTLENPYPFSPRAVRDLVYGRTVGETGITQFSHMVRFAVDTAIMDFIAAHTFDYLMDAVDTPASSRQTILRDLWGAGIRQRLRRTGADLLWVDIGHFEPVMDDVDDQRVDHWGVQWAGEALVNRAHGEAQHLAYHEIGRAQAQADMLQSILQSLEDADTRDDPDLEMITDEVERARIRQQRRREKMRNIFLIRTAQILDAMSEKPERKPLDAE